MSKREPRYEHLFTVSGDLNERTVWAYAHSGLTADERQAVEQHIAGCDFCRDAVEGAALVKSEAAWHQRLGDLMERVDERLGRKTKRKIMLVKAPARKHYTEKERNQTFTLRPAYLRVAAAAVFLMVVAGVFWYFNWKNRQNENLVVSEKSAPIAPQPAQPVAPAAKDSLAKDTSGRKADGSAMALNNVGTSNDSVLAEKNLESVRSDSLTREAEAPETTAAADTTPALKQMETGQDTSNRLAERDMLYQPEARSANYSARTSPPQNNMGAVSVSAPNTGQTNEDITNSTPQYKGGEKAVQNYIDSVVTNRDNFRPSKHKVELDMDASGKIVDVKMTILKRRLSSDETAIKNALMSMPAWKPAYRKGKPVKGTAVVNLEY